MTPHLEAMVAFVAVVGETTPPGEPLRWCSWPGQTHPHPDMQGFPLHSAALLRGGAVTIHRHPHAFLVEPNGTVWHLGRAAERRTAHTRRQGRAVHTFQPPGPLKLRWFRAQPVLCEAARRAYAERAGGDPTPGAPDSYAKLDGRLQAQWLPWTLRDEADFLARTPRTEQVDG